MENKDSNITNNGIGLETNILKFLTSDQKDQIRKNQFAVDFNKGENIFKQGAPMSHIIVITQGMAKMYLEGVNNKNILLHIMKSGQIVGGPGFFTDYKHHFSLTAIENTTANFIEVDEFKNLILKNAEFGLNLIAYLNRAHINIYDKIKINTHKQMNGRIANTLLYLSDKIYENDNFNTTLTRQDMADLSSMTKESAIRILKDFKNSGIITCKNNYFEINNKIALRGILESG